MIAARHTAECPINERETMQTESVRRFGGRKTQGVLGLGLALVAAMTFATASASAAPASNTQTVAVQSQQADLGGFKLQAPLEIPDPLLPVPIVLTDLTVSAKASWSGDLTTKLAWDDSKVRQGADLKVDRLATQTSGKMNFKWTLSGAIDGIDFGPTTIDKDDVTCDPKLSGGGFECETDSPGLALPGAVPSPLGFFVVKIFIGAKFDVTPEGAVVTRGLSIGGNSAAGPDDLSLTDSAQSETLSMPCTGTAGDAVHYGLDPYHWTPAATATEQVKFKLVEALDPLGASELFKIVDGGVGSEIVTNPNFDLTGAGFSTPMGSLLANNIKPTIAPIGTVSGQEGSPISFSANVGSQCPIDSYVWEFSNGTKSFGPNPKRTFADDGVYDGQLTVTDITGLSTTQSFTVDVSNVKPSVNAGPDTTEDWGRAVQLNGQATDPGSNDQSTLQYTWTFGDGSPSATGGPSVAHAYATPGDYTATLKVCDKDGGCDTDSAIVHVTRRDTALGYTGPLYSAPSKTVAVTATLVDEYDQPVAGKKVTFQLGSQTAVGTTDSTGKASASIKLVLKPGSYALSANYPAGDAKYNASGDTGLTFVVGNK
jgi:PKD domain-containing protein